jgi:CBS domain containing-hemolysin-like protein
VTAWVVLAVVALLLTGWVAAAETVVERLPLVRALRLEEDEVGGSDQLLWLIEHRTTARNALLLVTIIARATFIAAAIVVFDAWGVVGAVVLSMVLGEVAPRTWTLRHLEAAALRLAPGARALVRLLDPLTTVFIDVGRLVVGTRSDVPGPYSSDDHVDPRARRHGRARDHGPATRHGHRRRGRRAARGHPDRHRPRPLAHPRPPRQR